MERVLAVGLILLAAPARAGWGERPVSFEPNRGQTDASVDFVARSRDGIGFLSGGALTLQFDRCAAGAARPRALPRDCRSYALRMRLAGAGRRKAEGLEPLPGVTSYFIGADPSRWLAGIPTYGAVGYRDVLPGVDLRYHGSGPGRDLELDVVLTPGAGIGRRLRFAFEGADALALDAGGDLRVSIADQVVVLRRPDAYQEIDGARRAVAAGYVVEGKRRVAIALGAWDRSRPVVVDPVVMVYSAQFGSTVNDGLEAVAADAAGNAYAAGFSDGIGFPTTTGVLYTSTRGGTDAVVLKLDPTGSSLVYSTYLGGDGTDVAYGLGIDASGNAYVTGDTMSSNFPSPFGFQASLGGATDAFVAKLNQTGTFLAYASYAGGNLDEHGDAIAVDGSGAAYVAGSSLSATGWLTVGNTIQPGKNGARDAFALKLNASGGPVWFTYLGGSADDFAQGIAVDGSGRTYVAGGTSSGNFLGTNTSPIQPSIGGASDAFILKLSSAADQTLFSTYFGGTLDEQATCLALDPGTGGPVVAGQTTSTNFPTPVGAYGRTSAGGTDAFVLQLSSTGATLAYSTYLGGSGEDTAWSVAQGAGGAWVVGRTSSGNFPTAGSPRQGTLGGSGDAFITQVNGAGTGLLYSTYLGGGSDDLARGVAVDPVGSAFVVGESGTGFPVTSGSFQNTPRGAVDAFAAKFRDQITLSSINPTSGPTDGGTPVTLTGTNFTSNLSVSFGGSSVSGVLVSSTILSATTPPHAAGAVDVVVRASDNSVSNTLTNGFTYVPPDAGPPDAGPPDAGPPDAGPPDAGPPDAGPPDAGPPDAGPPDAGPPDAGPPDAGPPDAGPPDAGPPDGGTADGGAPDGGVPDGSVDLFGCSCASGGAGSSALALAALAVMAARARQRRRPTSAPPNQ